MEYKPLDYYFAGLFDGEGWFSIKRVKPNGNIKITKREYRFQAYAELVIREEFIIDLLCKRYGGTKRKQIPKNPKHSISYRWLISGTRLTKFAAMIATLGLCKHHQAVLILRLRAIKESNGNKSLTDDLYNQNCKLHEELSLLNRKGIGK